MDLVVLQYAAFVSAAVLRRSSRIAFGILAGLRTDGFPVGDDRLGRFPPGRKLLGRERIDLVPGAAP